MTKKGRGWHNERKEHGLASRGIKVRGYDHEWNKYRTEISPKRMDFTEKHIPKNVEYTGTKKRNQSKPEKLNFPSGLKENDREQYIEEMDEAQSNEERQEIHDKWSDWKSYKKNTNKTHFKTKIFPIAKTTDYPWLFVTNANSPPDGYRWVDEEDIDPDEENIIARVDYRGKVIPDDDYKLRLKSLEDYRKEIVHKRMQKYNYKNDKSPRSKTQKEREEKMNKIQEDRLEKYRKAKEERQKNNDNDLGIDMIK